MAPSSFKLAMKKVFARHGSGRSSRIGCSIDRTNPAITIRTCSDVPECAGSAQPSMFDAQFFKRGDESLDVLNATSRPSRTRESRSKTRIPSNAQTRPRSRSESGSNRIENPDRESGSEKDQADQFHDRRRDLENATITDISGGHSRQHHVCAVPSPLPETFDHL